MKKCIVIIVLLFLGMTGCKSQSPNDVVAPIDQPQPVPNGIVSITKSGNAYTVNAPVVSGYEYLTVFIRQAEGGTVPPGSGWEVMNWNSYSQKAWEVRARRQNGSFPAMPAEWFSGDPGTAFNIFYGTAKSVSQIGSSASGYDLNTVIASGTDYRPKN